MNKFVSRCRHHLVSFLFHAVTSLHPPSFHRNDFSTCSTHFSFFILRQSPINNDCAMRGQPTRTCNARRSVSTVEVSHDLQ